MKIYNWENTFVKATHIHKFFLTGTDVSWLEGNFHGRAFQLNGVQMCFQFRHYIVSCLFGMTVDDDWVESFEEEQVKDYDHDSGDEYTRCVYAW